VGASALAKDTTGGNNTAVGTSALGNNLTATDQVAVGYQALASSTTVYNVGVGSNALFSTSSGNANVGLGYDAGYTETPANANTTGSGNTYLGTYAGPGTTSQLNFTIAIGYEAHPTATGHAVIGNASVTDLYVGSESATGNVHGASGTFSGTVTEGHYTVSTLPTCNSGAKGATANVTDATSPTYLGTLTGGGAVFTPVVCNGTAWVSY
jgi:hypothetical protein